MVETAGLFGDYGDLAGDDVIPARGVPSVSARADTGWADAHFLS